ncbi:translation initiation factor IF-2 [Lysobacter capsici]|jgi:translation initiation factor IF-2|uniref:translation initiation factor IF-2 n=1 Tax=Lysobacter capsici TaxID=435897 RepID=UPI000627E628|nr:translation initiation factor IF-2 [Lysobacter capsici]ALN86264.1 translation initiation factor IF-2 [Lysobacter capsici]ATE72271.1 translation initiation factor IF-2 [Lysobacter capsici]UOF12825.1 translation initiation factor IF-2 [Lysobacter capsici]WND78379.1 translation initiation factor IF-2 [Lysobacter capsici]WND83574.1 translation initiation factor IF-2 [Lysobacter capsici]
MSQQTTIRKLAELVNTPVEKLLEQLAEAGMKFSGPDQVVTSIEKVKLLGFLKRSHGKADKPAETDEAAKKITLNRSRKQEITVGGGKNRTTVDVVVRKKVTLVKPNDGPMSPSDERADILRKLEESKQRNLAEQEKLAADDKRRADAAAAVRQAAEDAARAKAEEELKLKLADASAVAPSVSDAPTAATPAAVRKPAPTHGHGHPKPPAPATPARVDHNAPRNKTRGSHAMVAGVEDDDAANRFAGQLHLSPSDRARRTTNSRGKGGNRPQQRRSNEQARSGGGQHGFSRPTAPIVRDVAIGDTVTVADLAQKLALKGGDVVKALFKMGVMATINQSIDFDTAALVTEELGHTVVRTNANAAEDALIAHAEEVQGEKVARPPVVTIMGHVDHGKTSLLDYIRRTKVASGEAGGITQHIGAYHVETARGVISFLDTPGHSAFTSMRARGAKLTDIVVLVVAADDGVMPQTREAVQHAKAAGVPLIVAINKIDKSGADPLRVKNELLAEEVVAEDFGGDTQMVELSAKTGDGVDDLLDAISLQAEVLELRAVPVGRAIGTVIESSLDKGRGPVATVLVQQGQLKKGDYLVCGVQYGRVRALFDETGKQVEEAGPSIPVQVLGLSGVPDAGDDFVVVEDERLAKDVAQQRDAKRRESRLVAAAGNRMEDIMAQMGKGEGQLSLNLVIKADVQGSVEALRQALVALSNDQIRINVISSGVGGITESDANAAATAKATVIGFNVRADASARRIIEGNGVDLRYFSIIYDVIDQVKQVASGILGVEIREEIIGIAEVRDVFRSSKFGAVAGCMVVEGVVKRSKPIRVLRDNAVVFEGELESLRRFKENVDEVRNGTECGIGVKAYNDVKPGDQIECFERIEVQRTL